MTPVIAEHKETRSYYVIVPEIRFFASLRYCYRPSGTGHMALLEVRRAQQGSCCTGSIPPCRGTAEVAPRPWHTAAGAWLCDRCCGPPWPRSPAAAVRGPRGVQHRVIGREGLHKLCGPATVATSAQWSWCCAATRSPTPCRISPSMPPSSFLSPALPLPSWLACRPRVRRPTVQAGSCSLPDVRTVVPRRPSIFALGRAVLPARARSAAVARPSLPRACRSG
ncbi:unnamed protein product [Prorocentrum cordatum]|uniref:Uncharacterized protein n=1 Tax=Prorocentrum cordatum TaxID=2364126 RepID=A0ABN9PDF7_9DINO|nr:unnamed protein product [Polarella glacialis]